MGMMLAAAGAIGGLGKGLTQVGEESTQRQDKQQLMQEENTLATQREQAIERLRAQNQQQLQGAQFKHEDTQEARREEFQMKAASATRGFEQWKIKQQIDERRYASDNAYKARVDAAYIRALQTNKTGTTGKNNTASQYKDIPIADSTGAQRLLMAGPHGTYELIGDRYVPYNGETQKTMTERMSNARQSDVNVLMEQLRKDPNAVVPPGHTNSGMTYVQAFEQSYGYIPKPAVDTLRSVEQSQGQSGSGQTSSQTRSIQLPSGKLLQLPSGFNLAGGGAEPAEAEPAEPQETENPDDNSPAGG